LNKLKREAQDIKKEKNGLREKLKSEIKKEIVPKIYQEKDQFKKDKEAFYKKTKAINDDLKKKKSEVEKRRQEVERMRNRTFALEQQSSNKYIDSDGYESN
jgi:cytochrome c556